MVLHDQVDWRSLPDSLALDLTLLDSVFRGLSKQYEKKHEERLLRQNETQQSFKDDNNKDYRHGACNNQLDDMLFAKADVLVALETAEGYLSKRPWLRVLHTRLACVSFEKEGASLAGFVRYRQRDRMITLEAVRRRLEEIYADAARAKEVEDKHNQFLSQARASSPWCVRDMKWLHPSPARKLYDVHVLPPRPVTEEELEARRQCVANHAKAVVNAAVGVVVDKLLAPYARTTSASGRRSARRMARTDVDTSKIAANQRQVRVKRDQDERVSQLKTLRLELFAPTANLSAAHKVDDKEAGTTKKKDEIARVMLMLATVEAQGDGRLAHKLFEYGPLQAGLRRAAEQAKRLGITDQSWDVVKLWRELYRTSTLQAIGNMQDRG